MDLKRAAKFLYIIVKCYPVNAFTISIYWKRTFTGLYVKWDSFIPRKYKVNLIHTLIYFASICSQRFAKISPSKWLPSRDNKLLVIALAKCQRGTIQKKYLLVILRHRVMFCARHFFVTIPLDVTISASYNWSVAVFTTSLEPQESYLTLRNVTLHTRLSVTRDFFRQQSTFVRLNNAAASPASRLRSAGSLAITSTMFKEKPKHTPALSLQIQRKIWSFCYPI